jgi:hypothetical protein
MPRRSKETRAILRSIQRSEQRSPLFWWFVENHDEVQQAAQSARIDWASFCAEAAKRGLTDTHGRTPTERNARETWRQARRAVAEARSLQPAQGLARPGSTYPSRVPKDWRPQVVPAPQSLPPAGLAVSRRSQSGQGKWPTSSAPGSAAGSPTAPADGELSEHERDQFAKLDAMLAKADRRFRF